MTPRPFIPRPPGWDAIYAERGLGWDANPWVWAIGFEVIRENVDRVTP